MPNDAPTTETAERAEPDGSAVSARSVVRPSRKRSRFGQAVPDETVAAYGAARAFLLGEWFGSALMVASYALAYLFAFAPGRPSIAWALAACLALLALGSLVYLRSRAYYGRVGFDYAPRWHRATIVVAGSAGIFWLLFLILAVLTWLGVPVLPTK